LGRRGGYAGKGGPGERGGQKGGEGGRDLGSRILKENGEKGECTIFDKMGGCTISDQMTGSHSQSALWHEMEFDIYMEMETGMAIVVFSPAVRVGVE